MNKREQPPWTVVCHEPGSMVRRFGVPGGWLYQVQGGGTSKWQPPVFVPEGVIR